jgi:hypothetical protein
MFFITSTSSSSCIYGMLMLQLPEAEEHPIRQLGLSNTTRHWCTKSTKHPG